jgi:hypothetical protein
VQGEGEVGPMTTSPMPNSYCMVVRNSTKDSRLDPENSEIGRFGW